MKSILPTAKSKSIVLIILVILLVITFFLSLAMGQTSININTTLEAVLCYDASNTEHLIIGTTRLTRAIIATLIGASLAIAGILVQALTKNPLAAPDLLGINAGAMFFIVLAITFFDISSLTTYMWFAFLGAAISGLCVFFLGSMGREGLTPIKIILAGTALSALFISFTQGLLVIDEQKIQSVLFWIAGSVAGRNLDMILPVTPYLLVAIVLSLFMGRSLTIFSSGDDVATSLGQNTGVIKFVTGLLVIVLAGGSVAIAGSIGFVGLIVPHIVKGLVGADYRWIMPYGAVIGAILLLVADILARFLIQPQEVPIGVMTALIGGPFFIYIARKGLRKQ